MIGNNNLFNIRYTKRNNWIGQIGQKHGFCCFDTLDHGIRAAFKLLLGYIDRGYDTIEKIISRFAPSSENDTSAYINFCCSWHYLDVLHPDTKIVTYHDLLCLMVRMAKFENGYNIGVIDLQNSLSLTQNIVFRQIKMF